MTYQCTEEQFQKDVAGHQMQVIRDDGLYRHIRFTQPQSRCMQFDLITWPGHLCYTGDMGTYVFSRVEDMFCFFRTDPRDFNYNRAGGLSINTGYWAEKCLASCTRDSGDGIRAFSQDKFREVVEDYITNHIESHDLDEEAQEELLEAVEDEVLSCLDDGEHEAMSAAYSFNHNGFELTDFFENTFTEKTYQYVWCCYALAWGIQQYDKAMAKAGAA